MNETQPHTHRLNNRPYTRTHSACLAARRNEPCSNRADCHDDFVCSRSGPIAPGQTGMSLTLTLAVNLSFVDEPCRFEFSRDALTNALFLRASTLFFLLLLFLLLSFARANRGSSDRWPSRLARELTGFWR